MTKIAAGRTEFLQKGIIEAIKRAFAIDTLSHGGVENIFEELLKDETIRTELQMETKKVYMVGIDPIGASIKVIENPYMPAGTIMMAPPDKMRLENELRQKEFDNSMKELSKYFNVKLSEEK